MSLNSSDRQYTSHSIIAAEVGGAPSGQFMNVAMVPDYKISQLISYSPENKAATTLEQIFTGMANQAGIPTGDVSGSTTDAGNFPYMKNYTSNPANVSDGAFLTSRFSYGTELIVGESGTIKSVGMALPMYGAGFGYDVNGNVVPNNNAFPISSISSLSGYVVINKTEHLLTPGNGITVLDSSIASYNKSTVVQAVLSKDSFLTYIPFVSNLSSPDAGKYYTIFDLDMPQSGLSSRNGSVNTLNLLSDAQYWKAGPVDLRWDDNRGVWCGSDFFTGNILWGYLASDIKPANGRNDPTPFRMKTYKQNKLPIYIVSFEEENSITNHGTLIRLVPNQLELQPGDKFTIAGTNTSYDGLKTLVKQSSDRLSLIINTAFNSGAIANVTDIGYVTVDITNNDDVEVPRIIDKTYIVYNYDTHLSVSLISKCSDVSGSCINVEDDIFIGAVKKSESDIRPFYIGFANE